MSFPSASTQSPPPDTTISSSLHHVIPPQAIAKPTTNTHPMVTRSKAGISKPKAYTAKPSSIDYTLTEPSTCKAAVQFPQWCSAMDEEFDALQRQGTWSLFLLPLRMLLAASGCLSLNITVMVQSVDIKQN